MKVVKADLTKIKADAIVNAANSSLMGGGGVDGAIHAAGGREILEECKKIIAKQGSCKTGEAVITTAGKLPAKFVIHTVGAVWKGGQHGEKQKLADCYFNSLKLAKKYKLLSIAFPNISTGVYGFPKAEAAKIAVRTVKEFIVSENSLMEVLFVCYDQDNFDFIQTELNNG